MSPIADHVTDESAEPSTVPRALELRLTTSQVSRCVAKIRRHQERSTRCLTNEERKTFGQAAHFLKASIDEPLNNESPSNRHQPDLLMLRADALNGADLSDIREELRKTTQLLEAVASGANLSAEDVDHLDEVLLALRTALARETRRTARDQFS